MNELQNVSNPVDNFGTMVGENGILPLWAFSRVVLHYTGNCHGKLWM